MIIYYNIIRYMYLGRYIIYYMRINSGIKTIGKKTHGEKPIQKKPMEKSPPEKFFNQDRDIFYDREQIFY